MRLVPRIGASILIFLAALPGAAQEQPSSPLAALAPLEGLDRIVSDEVGATDPRSALDAVARSAGLTLVASGYMEGTPPVIAGKTVRDALSALAERYHLIYGLSPDGRTLTAVAPHIAGRNGVTNPRRIQRPKEQSREADGLVGAGEAIVQTVIDESGTIVSTEVLSCKPCTEGYQDWAISTVRRWRFEPAQLEGSRVRVYYTVVVAHELEGP